MRVVLIMAGDEEGGLENHVTDLAKALSMTDEVHVIAHEKYRERMGAKVVFHALDLSGGRRNPLLLYRLRDRINKIDPDILHAHANKAVEMISRIRRWIDPDIRCVATLHSQKKSLNAYERFDHVIGVSHRVLASLKDVETSVVYNGLTLPAVDHNPEYLKQFGIGEGFVLCAVGRMERVKNFEMLIHAVAPLDLTLLFVGEGSQKEELKAISQRVGGDSKVRFAGYREDVASLLYHSDLCVISSDREGFSYVMAEALLLQRPVVSTDVGDMRRILPSECVVPTGDMPALRSVIERCMKNYESCKGSFASSFDLASQRFTVEAMVRGVKEVYEKVAAR